ncbi:MAG: DUF4266 domain-containing protein [Thiohalomonadaceae bacterium]
MNIVRLAPLALALLATGCTLEPVRPWERDLLAKPEMQLVPDAVENFLDQHIEFSKEGSFGGQGVGGGGCGCN